MSPPWTNLAGLAVGGPLYGIYLMLYILSTFLLVKRSTGAPSAPLYRSAIFVSGLVLFIAVTGNWILTVVRPFIGFVVFLNGTAAPAFFDDNSQITTTIQNSFIVVAILVSDGIIIYRLWIVWSRNKIVIILPILTLLGLAIAFILTLQTTTHIDDIAEDKGLTPGLIFTLTYVLCSAFKMRGLMIVYQYKHLLHWQITKTSSPVGGSNLRDFLSIIVESALIYTIWTIFYIIAHQINSNLQFVAVILLPAVAGISNALIQARIGMDKTIETQHPLTGHAQSFSYSNSNSAGAALRMTTHHGDDPLVSRSDLTEMKPMAI
ncbi:hypothetical protein DFH08DRAFT_950231 [Mycena albidolilacea]|uniref:Uncharacterized protein n=1 Tax=Mycena albidolilacea TaxID=1033008 RepID=A0AAD7APT1_9AGAR|nr:hypothetical protein DFH08DRAFT_950231 [Mycena albidolilacea]